MNGPGHSGDSWETRDVHLICYMRHSIRAVSEVYEVCIVGAGITGLNALVVAGSYLSRTDKVLLVDSRSRAGGMWTDTYDYVRLHQPHPIFTAGSIAWDIGQPPSHLASKPEVLRHLQRCLDIAKKSVTVDERFGWDYVSHEEASDSVLVTLRSPDGATKVVAAKRLIKAFGNSVPLNAPLSTSSRNVHSVTPELLNIDDLRNDDAPIWVVGSGKTAMDTVQRLITEFPDREVNMIAGPGTSFSRRDTFFPTGSKRWWAGTPINVMLRQVGRRFDGTNEIEVLDWFRLTYGIGPTAQATDFFGAYLSDAECVAITAGLSTVEQEYFADAVDGANGVDLVYRSGRSRNVPAGSWLVNCTGSILRRSHEYEPFVSPSGMTLSIQMRSTPTGIFAPFSGYYLTHLMFRNQLVGLGLYELDIEELYRKAKPLVVFASMSVSLLSLSLISETLPNKVLLGCGLDYDRWYPLPRRMASVTEFLATHRRDREHHRRTLETLGSRFEVRSGPLVH